MLPDLFVLLLLSTIYHGQRQEVELTCGLQHECEMRQETRYLSECGNLRGAARLRFLRDRDQDACVGLCGAGLVGRCGFHIKLNGGECSANLHRLLYYSSAALLHRTS